MDKEPDLYAIRYTFASILEDNPEECIVYIGGFSAEEARQNFGNDLERINRKYLMYYKYNK